MGRGEPSCVASESPPCIELSRERGCPRHFGGGVGNLCLWELANAQCEIELGLKIALAG